MKKKVLSFMLCIAMIVSVFIPSGYSFAESGDTYNADTIYYAGNTVVYNGITYTAKWYTRGDTPGEFGSPWERAAEYDSNGIAIWYDGMVCTGGTQVSYNGNIYTAKWWTMSVPGSDSSWDGVSSQPPAGDVPDNDDTGEQGQDPSDPIAPDDPTDPTDPTDPVDPVVPSDPETPADSGTWISTKVYFNGDTVVYGGYTYTAKYYNIGEEPSSSGAWQKETEYDEDGIAIWYDGMVCTGGTQVSYNGTVYEAKWWTTSVPGSDSSWKIPGQEETPIYVPDVPGGDPVIDPNGPVGSYDDYTVDETLVAEGDSEFKTVGYFPFYSAYWADNIQWDCLTHIVYAFAFPNGQGGLQPLDDVALVQKLISEGHRNGVKVLLGVGGWAYYGTVMEYNFDANTATPELTDTFTDAILDLVDLYGFDGVDIDWEHPRAGTDSWRRYEAMMIQLREKLGSGKLLTSAVLSGVTTGGVVYADAAAHTANVMAVCDWFNVMAYDCICTLDFCQDVAQYWCGTRGMPANKVCMGVPFYTYPSCITYASVISTYGSEAVYDDLEGTYYYHNSVNTMQAKTEWAMEYGLGGIMIWEISQDSTDETTSLLRAIYNTVNAE